MIAIICIFIICVAAIIMYTLYLVLDNEPKQLTEENPAVFASEAPIKDPPETLAEEMLAEKIIPKLAQEYLDAEKKLIKKARGEDMSGYSVLGDNDRKEAAKCRAKAEKLIKEANNV